MLHPKYFRAAILLLVLTMTGSADAAVVKSLFFGADFTSDDVMNDILGPSGTDPRFDYANSSFQNFGPLTLPFLLQFDSVLVWSNYGHDLSDIDLLADYVDAGGRVVIATFMGQSTLGSGTRLNDPGYNPLAGPVENAYTIRTLGAYNASHPLMAGVSSLSSDYYNADFGSLSPGATLVASWDDGRPLAAVNAAGNVVSISLFPDVITWAHATGDYRELFRNALAGNLAAVPEPASCVLFSFGAAMFGFARFRRRTRLN